MNERGLYVVQLSRSRFRVCSIVRRRRSRRLVSPEGEGLDSRPHGVVMPDLSSLERFALIQLLLEREGGQVSWPMEDVEHLVKASDGWAAVVLIRPEAVTVRAVSPERRAELLAMGFHEHG